MADAKSRARVTRLLSDNFRPDDLTGLFLFARDHCDGRESVAEIGHFVAHHNEREKGIVTQSTREWFASVRFHMARFTPNGPVPLDGNRLPSTTRAYLEIALNRISPKVLTQHSGLRLNDARRIMSVLIPRLKENADGTWTLPQDLSKPERKLVEAIASLFVAKPAFEAERLVEDFAATLKSNGLISKDELREHGEKIGILVQLYALAAMHNCVVQIGDGTTTILRGRPTLESKEIAIDAAVPGAVPNASNIDVASAIFSVKLDPAIYCHPGLLNSKWDFEIELAPDGRLAAMV